jgi:hypothetical protein
MYFVKTYLVRPKLPLISLGVVGCWTRVHHYFVHAGRDSRSAHQQLVSTIVRERAGCSKGCDPCPWQAHVCSTADSRKCRFLDSFDLHYTHPFPFATRFRLSAINSTQLHAVQCAIDCLDGHTSTPVAGVLLTYLVSLCQDPAKHLPDSCRQNSWSTGALEMPSPHQQHTTSW